MSENNAPVITEESVLSKVSSGEELTPQEVEFVKGNPNLEKSADKSPDDKSGTASPDDSQNAAKPADKAESSSPAPITAKTTEEKIKLIDSELDKPENERDLSKFKDDPVLLGLYFEARKTRKKNQKLEEENGILRFNQIKQQAEKDAKAAEALAAEEDPLLGKDDDDVLTVAEARALLKKINAKPAVKDPAQSQPIMTVETVRAQSIIAKDILTKKGVTDVDEVLMYAEDALIGDADAQDTLREVAEKGGNVVEQTYYLIKASKRWPMIKAYIEAEKAKTIKPPIKPGDSSNEDRAKRFEQNSGKIRTTGPAGGAGAEPGEYSLKELASMTEADWRKLPRETQQAILQKHGSNPNLNR